MAGCRTLVSWFSALCVVLALVVFLVGFVTPWWLQAHSLDSQVGLWRQCVGDHCTDTIHLDIGDWLIACQALSVTALLSSSITLGLVIVMVRASRDSTLTNARYGAIATSLLTGLTMGVTLTIYHLQSSLFYPDEIYSLSVSFFLVLVSAGIFLLVTLALALFSVTACLCHSAS